MHRDKPGRALHIGRVRPEGHAWARGVEERQLGAGRPPNAHIADVDELMDLAVALGGVTSAAKTVGCSRKTLARYLAGDRHPTPDVLNALRDAAREAVA